ncbi:MAG: flagellin [Pirellulales bacterium]|nr:flagellin [Pirellulales bacterium]
MTRINTNVSSLVAQKTLARSNNDLQLALTRLSTGLRINTGKDDPAGLIASEALRSDINSVKSAIGNSERANQVIATADSALGQVSSLLNDIRGLITEAANTGALSDEQIAANQLQVDSSLEAIDRIAQVTSFQGRRLLDGSLNFITTAANVASIEDVQIDQANLGSAGTLDVDIDISAAATQAQVTVASLQATGVIDFAGANNEILLTAAAAGETFNNVNVVTAVAAGGGAGPELAAAFAGSTLTLTFDSDHANFANVGAAAIKTAIDLDGTFTTADAAGSTGGGSVDASAAGFAGTTVGNTYTVQDITLEISDGVGTEVFSFQAGTTVDQIVAAVNLVSDATGVTATNNSGVLELDSSTYGSDSFVAVDVISEDSIGTFTANLSALRAEGTDIVATVNGVLADGKGNTLSLNTAALDLSVTVSDGSSTDVDFSIIGGGALFQLGPDVVTNQQARLGIQSLNSARLGGASGRLFEIRSGGSKSLSADPGAAAKIVDEVISKVTGLRGRLGAFQKTTLETNIFALSDTLENLTDAESAIRDADFAAESASLTRAQILVQSGTSVLSIANSNPQNVLALLR